MNSNGDAVFRRGNEAIAEVARRAGVDDVEIAFVCECTDPYCLARVQLNLRAYERICAAGGAVALPGHAT